MSLYQSRAIKPIEDDFFEIIVNKLNTYLPLSPVCQEKLQSVLSEITYKKGSHILSAGAKQQYAWFSIDGLMQEIAVDQESFSTKTTWFWFGFAFIYAVPGFFDRGPSQVTINVVKDSRVAMISYEDWNGLKNECPEIETLTEKLRTEYQLMRRQHSIDRSSLSTAERYLKYESRINLLFQYIKLKHIAEYLGMSTDTLGKLRRNSAKIFSPPGG